MEALQFLAQTLLLLTLQLQVLKVFDFKLISYCNIYIFVVVSIGVESAAQEIDPWDMLDPVDVLAKLPGNFMEGTDSKKWIDRRDALQSLLALCTENPKLCPKANYGEFVALLKKVIKFR